MSTATDLISGLTGSSIGEQTGNAVGNTVSQNLRPQIDQALSYLQIITFAACVGAAALVYAAYQKK